MPGYSPSALGAATKVRIGEPARGMSVYAVLTIMLVSVAFWPTATSPSTLQHRDNPHLAVSFFLSNNYERPADRVRQQTLQRGLQRRTRPRSAPDLWRLSQLFEFLFRAGFNPVATILRIGRIRRQKLQSLLGLLARQGSLPISKRCIGEAVVHIRRIGIGL